MSAKLHGKHSAISVLIIEHAENTAATPSNYTTMSAVYVLPLQHSDTDLTAEASAELHTKQCMIFPCHQ